MWRLRARNKNIPTISYNELRYVIMHEIGTDVRTYITNRNTLKRLKWIQAVSTRSFRLTNKDLTGDE